MSISCYGASVTAQKTGYAFYLQKLLKKKINVHGFGGEHIVHGGVVHINEVIKHNPSLCFIDWFSTGFLSTDKKIIVALDTIKYKFTTNNCKIIFLFLPRKDHNKRIIFYNFVKDYLNSNNISFIDINKYISYNDKLLSDNVHTTEYGSEKYANIIFKEYNNMKIKRPINLNKNKFCYVKELQVNKIFHKKLELKGNCEVLSCGLQIGPNSGYLNINNNLYLIWDQCVIM